MSGLLGAQTQQLRGIKGLGGTAKRAELGAVLELARRAMGALDAWSARAAQRRADERHEDNLQRFGHIEGSIRELRSRLTIWGAVAAVVPGLIVLAIELWRALR